VFVFSHLIFIKMEIKRILIELVIFISILWIGYYIFVPSYLSLQPRPSDDTYDAVFVNMNLSRFDFKMINESNYANLTFSEKQIYHHEKCHQQQNHQDRVFYGKWRYLNEVECYVREYLFL